MVFIVFFCLDKVDSNRDNMTFCHAYNGGVLMLLSYNSAYLWEFIICFYLMANIKDDSQLTTDNKE